MQSTNVLIAYDIIIILIPNSKLYSQIVTNACFINFLIRNTDKHLGSIDFQISARRYLRVLRSFLFGELNIHVKHNSRREPRLSWNEKKSLVL